MQSDNLLTSYKNLRRVIGIMGMLLSFLLPFGQLLDSQPLIQRSISFYYWTGSRDMLVGILFTTGALLLTYKGYDKADRRLAFIAGLAILGVAIFPCYNTDNAVGFFKLGAKVNDIIHLVAATSFFCALAYMSLFQFTKGSTTKKVWGISKNTIYKYCGYIILIGLLLLVLLSIGYGSKVLQEIKIIFYIESIMLWAFGVSWLVKGLD